MNEEDIQQFWDDHPCGETQVGGIKGDFEEFFNRYDAFRYKQHKHLLKCRDTIDFKKKMFLKLVLA